MRAPAHRNFTAMTSVKSVSSRHVRYPHFYIIDERVMIVALLVPHTPYVQVSTGRTTACVEESGPVGNAYYEVELCQMRSNILI